MTVRRRGRSVARYPGAIARPGPNSKQNGGLNTTIGVVCHSMVGTFAGAMSRLDGFGPRNEASWHFSVLQNGQVYQHYDTLVQCWHAGSSYNNTTIGIEHEGGYDPYDEPLTEAQRVASVNLVRWLSQKHGFALERGNGLWEHNEVSDKPTLCPSHRIPWAFYTEEEHMPTPEYNELKQADQDIEKVIIAKEDGLKAAIAALAQANAGSFKAIEDRLTALEQK